MRARENSGAGPADNEVWRRSQRTEATPDEAEYLLDLAAFADNRLDEDDTARVAAWLAHDADAAGDVAAARLLGNAESTAADPDIVLRAEALVDAALPEAILIEFPRQRRALLPWYSAASWSGLAAAIVLAGWLGFDLGSGISNAPSFGRSPDEVSASEIFDPAPLLLRDFTESSQI